MHLVVAAELRILVRSELNACGSQVTMRVDAELVERGDQRARELLEQHLVAGAAHAFAGRAFARAEDAEAHAARAQDLRRRRAAICWPRGSNDFAEPT